MPSRRVLRCVLHNLLGTFASRHSDLHGYWLFGQLPADLDAWTVDLRGDPPAGETPLDAARRLAIGRFRDQLSKARLDPSVIREASLSWSREEPTVGWQCEHEAQGHRVSVRARAVTDLGRTIEQARSVFVARHDPNRERRRLPIHWGR